VLCVVGVSTDVVCRAVCHLPLDRFGAPSGYAWYPEETIREELDNGQLKPLPLAEGGERAGTLYLRRAPECDALPSSFARAWQRARSRAPWRAARSRADSCGNADLRHGLDTEDVTH
jgi:hypothetical protein